MTSATARPMGLKVILGILAVELLVLVGIVVAYVAATLAGEVRDLPTMLALVALRQPPYSPLFVAACNTRLAHGLRAPETPVRRPMS